MQMITIHITYNLQDIWLLSHMIRLQGRVVCIIKKDRDRPVCEYYILHDTREDEKYIQAHCSSL